MSTRRCRYSRNTAPLCSDPPILLIWKKKICNTLNQGNGRLIYFLHSLFLSTDNQTCTRETGKIDIRFKGELRFFFWTYDVLPRLINTSVEVDLPETIDQNMEKVHKIKRKKHHHTQRQYNLFIHTKNQLRNLYFAWMF